MITIGIPSRGDNPRIPKMIKYCLSDRSVSEIIVSINPPYQEGGELEKQFKNEGRVKIIRQKNDLGLYGNFQFLFETATSKYFQWFCTDDLPSPEWAFIIGEMEKSQLALGIPAWYWQEWNPNKEIFFGDITVGPIPGLEHPYDILVSGVRAEPSWIFGIWNREMLLRIWPRIKFDWLDVYILNKVLVSARCQNIEVSTPTIIGTWNWADKVPSSVSPKGPYSFASIFYSSSFLPKYAIAGKKLFLEYIGRNYGLIQISRNMRKAKKPK